MGAGSQTFNPLARPIARRANGRPLLGGRVLAGSRAAVMPSPVFPAGVATDADLLFGQNRVATTLVSGISATDASITVVDPTGISVNMVLSLGSDGEIVKVVGSGAGQSFPVQRGFDGTTPIAHSPGDVVLGNIVAFHHNALVAEIEAIESALGPHLSNVSGGGLIFGPTYTFAPQTPGMNLVPGPNTIPLSPVPLGVSGTDMNHWLYIDQGTGTPEAVMILGGTAVGGAPTGTIVVNCANAHSGSWRISTATAGLQEAHNANPGAMIFYPAGLFDWYAPFWSNGYVTVMGSGYGQQGQSVSTIFRYNALATKMFDIERPGFILRQVLLRQVGIPVAGNVGIYTCGENSAVANAACNDALLEDVVVSLFYNGIETDGGGQSVNFSRVQVINSISDGIISRGSQGYWSAIISEDNGGNGIFITEATGAPVPHSGASPFMAGIQTFNNGGWGLYCRLYLTVSGMPSFFNNDYLGEIYVDYPNAVQGGWISDADIQFAGLTTWKGTNPTAPGISLATNCSPLIIHNIQFFNCQGNGFQYLSGGHFITSCEFEGSGQGAQAGNNYAIRAMDSSQSTRFIGNLFLGGGCLFDGGGQAHMLIGNSFLGNIATVLVQILSGTEWTISNNWFVNIGGGGTLTIAAGVTYFTGTNGIFYGLVNNGALSAFSNTLS